MVIGQRWVQVGEYVDKGRLNGFPILAGKKVADIAVVYWPEKRPIGLATIQGPNPPSSIDAPELNKEHDASLRVSDREDEGLYQSIADYISHLPRVQ
jgi:hypothetical protein